MLFSSDIRFPLPSVGNSTRFIVRIFSRIRLQLNYTKINIGPRIKVQNPGKTTVKQKMPDIEPIIGSKGGTLLIPLMVAEQQLQAGVQSSVLAAESEGLKFKPVNITFTNHPNMPNYQIRDEI